MDVISRYAQTLHLLMTRLKDPNPVDLPAQERLAWFTLVVALENFLKNNEEGTE